MFNDIEKKLRLTAVANLIVGVAFFQFASKFMIIVTSRDKNGDRTAWVPQSTVSTVCNILTVIAVIVSILSVWIAIALTKDKRGPFKWLSKAGKTIRILGWISLIGGIGVSFALIFWAFFNVESQNAVVNAISFAIIMIIPMAVLTFCFAFFVYGLGNAADGGDAFYVQDTILHDMAPLHSDDDKRKVCPNCGTRTDKHSCPNCGVRID